MGMTLSELQALIQKEVDQKFADVNKATSDLSAAKAALDSSIAQHKAQIEQAAGAATGFWKSEKKVILLSFGCGFVVAIILAIIGISIRS
jgi:hypothetical protein